MNAPKNHANGPGRRPVTPPPDLRQNPEPTSEDAGTAPMSLNRIVGGGKNADQCLEELLGEQPNRRTGDVEADCIAAIHYIDEWLTQLDLRRALIYHALHSQYYPQNKDVWLNVALAVGHPKSTVHKHAHPPALTHDD